MIEQNGNHDLQHDNIDDQDEGICKYQPNQVEHKARSRNVLEYTLSQQGSFEGSHGGWLTREGDDCDVYVSVLIQRGQTVSPLRVC